MRDRLSTHGLRSSTTALLVLLGASCHSVEWLRENKEHGVEWRGRSAFVAADDTVLASSEAAAQDAALFMERLRPRLSQDASVDPGRGLLIAVELGDLPLLDDPAELMALLNEMHAAATGAPVSTESMPPTAGGEAEMEIRRLTAQTQAAAVPAHAAELDLPAKLVERAAWIFVYPTDRCIAQYVDRMIDLSIERRGLSLAERAIFSMARGFAEDKLVEEFEDKRGLQLCQLMATVAKIDPAEEPSRAESLASAFGLPLDTLLPPKPPPEIIEVTSEEMLASMDTVSVPTDERNFVIHWDGETSIKIRKPRFDTRVFIIPTPRFGLRVQEVGSIRFVQLHCHGSIGTAEWNQLFEAIGREPGRVVLRAPTREMGAALATLYALRVRGLSEREASDLWHEYGMQGEPDYDVTRMRANLHLGY